MGSGTLVRPPGTSSASGSEAAGEPAIDPRISARRLRVQRDQGRRRLWKVAALVSLLALVAGAAAALRSPLLDVDHVVVSGADHTGSEAVVAASGVRRQVAMADVALGVSSRRVAALAWVHTATVRRVWPGTIRITVTERQPLAQVRAAGGGWLLVDSTGRLLARQPKRGRLVTLAGATARPPGDWLDTSWRDPLRVASAMPDVIRAELVSVGHGARGTILALSGGTAVVLGDGNHVGPKLSALRTLLDQPDRRCFATIYLAVPGAPALTRRPECV